MDWSLWEVIWTTFVVFIWISVIIMYVHVVIDIFRSHDLSGWGKAGWLVVLLVLPLIGLLIYVIARGPAMTQRAVDDQLARADALRQSMGEGGGGDPADQIARGKQLLDGGAIDAEEFAQIKRRALAG
jgi:hypothetical protein